MDDIGGFLTYGRARVDEEKCRGVVPRPEYPPIACPACITIRINSLKYNSQYIKIKDFSISGKS